MLGCSHPETFGIRYFTHITGRSQQCDRYDSQLISVITYAQVWNEAEPVPISRQEPLFNHVIEAEKVPEVQRQVCV